MGNRRCLYHDIVASDGYRTPAATTMKKACVHTTWRDDLPLQLLFRRNYKVGLVNSKSHSLASPSSTSTLSHKKNIWA